jgi:glycosyltransferase involved in cell wall biosynthesis
LRALRIMHIAEALGGGVLEVVRELTAGLLGRGHTVCLAYGVRPETPEDIASLMDPRLTLHRTSWQDRSLPALVAASAEIRRIADEWEPDVIHLHSSFAGMSGAISLARSYPIIYSPHSYAFQMRSHGILRRAAYLGFELFVTRRVHAIGAVSSHEGDIAENVLRARNVIVVRNGLRDFDERVVDREPSGTGKKVAAAGRISSQRQPEACARILARVSDLAELEWLGGVPRPESAAEPLFQAAIPISGWLGAHELRNRLSELTIYLHWSAWDGLPMTVLEAIAAGAVVVGRDYGPLRELLPADQRCRTEDEAVAAIRQLLERPGLRMRARARQLSIAADFGVEQMVSGWEKAYEALASQPHREDVLSRVPLRRARFGR